MCLKDFLDSPSSIKTIIKLYPELDAQDVLMSIAGSDPLLGNVTLSSFSCICNNLTHLDLKHFLQLYESARNAQNTENLKWLESYNRFWYTKYIARRR